MKIRLAKLSDYEELMKLNTLLSEEDRFSKGDGDSFKKILKSATNFVFVAENDNNLVGFATLSIRDVIRRPKPIAQLDELFVLEEHRKHGFGKQLISAVEKKATDLGCFGLYIESAYKHTAGHKFYEASGYKNEGYYFKKTL